MQDNGEPRMLASLRDRFPISKLCSTSDFVHYAMVDAFTDVPFKGNPAGICLLPAWPETHWMQQVASELNVNMMAFLVTRKDTCNRGDQKDNGFDIRWFTPVVEVDLCGHATLAASYLLFGSGMVAGDLIEFHPVKGGVLCARRVEKHSNDGFLVELAFPILPSYEFDFKLATLSTTFKDVVAVSVHKTVSNDLLVELPSGEDVKLLKPSFDEIRNTSFRGLIVTGQASNSASCDFVSRFFAPKVGINEDPVCGQAHCALAAFWAKKLHKTDLVAFQASQRSGTLLLRVDFETDRVYLQGEATLVMSGVLFR